MGSDPVKEPEFKRVLGNLLKSKPKHHSEMKVGKKGVKSGQRNKSARRGAAKNRP